MSFLEFIQEWGYIAVFLGSIVEGESIVFTASALAACGHMSIYKVFLIACGTTIFVDQLTFFIGYKFGSSWIINRFPKLQKARDRIFELLNKMDVLFIFSFRFIYGIRTISPLILGSARIRPPRFMIFNALSGICWAFALCFIGYVVADVFMDGEFDTTPAFVAVTGMVLIVIGAVFIISKIKKKP